MRPNAGPANGFHQCPAVPGLYEERKARGTDPCGEVPYSPPGSWPVRIGLNDRNIVQNPLAFRRMGREGLDQHPLMRVVLANLIPLHSGSPYSTQYAIPNGVPRRIAPRPPQRRAGSTQANRLGISALRKRLRRATGGGRPSAGGGGQPASSGRPSTGRGGTRAGGGTPSTPGGGTRTAGGTLSTGGGGTRAAGGTLSAGGRRRTAVAGAR